jgi:FkbM family methyltransferase
MKAIRYTQQSKIKLILEKLVKSNVIFYKIAFEIKEKILGSLFHEEDLDGIKYLKVDKTTHTCIDIGANVGQTIEYLKTRFKKVYAFEPNIQNYNYLKKKYKRNNKIAVFNYALGEKKEKKNLFIPYWKNFICLHHSASFFKDECYSTLKEFLNIDRSSLSFKKTIVNVEKLDKFNFNNVSLIKIDAEGSEKSILIGMKKYLKSSNLSLLIENSPRSFKFCKKFLKTYGYEPLVYRNSKFSKKSVSKALNVYFFKKQSR